MTKWDLSKECKVISTYKSQCNNLYQLDKGQKTHGYLN